MNQTRVLLVVFLLLMASCIAFFVCGFVVQADFAMKGFGALSVILAVAMALYGDVVRDTVQPLKLSIGVPETTNSMTDWVQFNGGGRIPRALLENGGGVILGQNIDVYCLHLVVRERGGIRVVKDCRVWLTRVLNVDVNGNTIEPFKFAVPRLMQWAPGEFSPELRSFGRRQVFDFGLLYVNAGVFDLTTKQGGNFDCSFRSPHKRRFVFQIEREGFMAATEHSVDVTILVHVPDQNWAHPWRAAVEPVVA